MGKTTGSGHPYSRNSSGISVISAALGSGSTGQGCLMSAIMMKRSLSRAAEYATEPSTSVDQGDAARRGEPGGRRKDERGGTGKCIRVGIGQSPPTRPSSTGRVGGGDRSTRSAAGPPDRLRGQVGGRHEFRPTARARRVGRRDVLPDPDAGAMRPCPSPRGSSTSISKGPSGARATDSSPPTPSTRDRATPGGARWADPVASGPRGGASRVGGHMTQEIVALLTAPAGAARGGAAVRLVHDHVLGAPEREVLR